VRILRSHAGSVPPATGSQSPARLAMFLTCANAASTHVRVPPATCAHRQAFGRAHRQPAQAQALPHQSSVQATTASHVLGPRVAHPYILHRLPFAGARKSF
jgi:hypothetical protein